MIVTSSGIKDGYWEKKYGKYGYDFISGTPSLSVPFRIQNSPKETKSFAVILKDDDAVAVAGHSWIHWLIANLKKENILPDESRTSQDFIQGCNSRGENYYEGMMPPNAPHNYDLYVYALDCDLDLKSGFSEAELLKAMAGHILDKAVITGKYNN